MGAVARRVCERARAQSQPSHTSHAAPATLRRLRNNGAVVQHGVDACALRGSFDEVHFGHPHLGVENAAAHHREASERARDLPASFVVLATPKQQVVTLELADAAQARALVEAIHMQADLAA